MVPWFVAAVSARKITVLMRFALLLQLCLNLFSEGSVNAENVYCTYYRDTNEVTCGTRRCQRRLTLTEPIPNDTTLHLTRPPHLMKAYFKVSFLDATAHQSWLSFCCKAPDESPRTVTCETAVPLLVDQPNLDVDGLDAKLPRGWYRIGVMQVRHDHGWFNLYRRRATGQGYWDFYTQVPERNCIGGFGMHAGENMAGTVTLKDKRCFDRLANQIERKSTTEKFDVLQCRKCIFNSCWLGTRTLPDQRVYLTNLRSY